MAPVNILKAPFLSSGTVTPGYFDKCSFQNEGISFESILPSISIFRSRTYHYVKVIGHVHLLPVLIREGATLFIPF
jgi:hypothetical protein